MGGGGWMGGGGRADRGDDKRIENRNTFDEGIRTPL